MKKILAIFDLPVVPILPTRFRVNWPFGSGEEAQNRISGWQPWQPSWISDLKDFSFIYLQLAPILPAKFRVNCSFGSREEAVNKFSRSQPSWISNQNDFSYL